MSQALHEGRNDVSNSPDTFEVAGLKHLSIVVAKPDQPALLQFEPGAKTVEGANEIFGTFIRQRPSVHKIQGDRFANQRLKCVHGVDRC